MDGSNEAIPGWWLASDGRWYRPEDLPKGWEIGAGGAPVRAVAPTVEPVVAPVVPEAVAPVDAVSRSFSVARAAPVVVLALVLGYVFLGGDGGGGTQVLGAVENRTTTTDDTARNVATETSRSLPATSLSSSTPDPAKLTAGALGAKPITTTTLNVTPGRAGTFGTGGTTTTTAPRSGPVPTTTTTVVVPVPPTVPGTPTTRPPSTTAPSTTTPSTTIGATTTTATLPPSTTTRPPSTTLPPTTTSPPATTTTPPTTTSPTTTTTTLPPTTTLPTTTTTSPPATTTTVVPATCSATVSDSTPRDGQSITVNVISSLRNAPVVLTIRYQSGPSTRNGTTSGVGLAFINFNIGNQPGGFLVVVDVKVGATATCQTSFRPH